MVFFMLHQLFILAFTGLANSSEDQSPNYSTNGIHSSSAILTHSTYFTQSKVSGQEVESGRDADRPVNVEVVTKSLSADNAHPQFYGGGGWLRCHKCISMGPGDPGDDCYNIPRKDGASADAANTELLPGSSRSDSSLTIANCNTTQHFCQVHRVEYLHSGGKETESGSDVFKPWSMERGCAERCNDFCVTMGARTKIRYCTSCCNSDLCNVDNMAATKSQMTVLVFAFSWSLVTFASHSLSATYYYFY